LSEQPQTQEPMSPEVEQVYQEIKQMIEACSCVRMGGPREFARWIGRPKHTACVTTALNRLKKEGLVQTLGPIDGTADKHTPVCYYRTVLPKRQVRQLNLPLACTLV